MAKKGEVAKPKKRKIENDVKLSNLENIVDETLNENDLEVNDEEIKEEINDIVEEVVKTIKRRNKKVDKDGEDVLVSKKGKKSKKIEKTEKVNKEKNEEIAEIAKQKSTKKTRKKQAEDFDEDDLLVEEETKKRKPKTTKTSQNTKKSKKVEQEDIEEQEIVEEELKLAKAPKTKKRSKKDLEEEKTKTDKPIKKIIIETDDLDEYEDKNNLNANNDIIEKDDENDYDEEKDFKISSIKSFIKNIVGKNKVDKEQEEKENETIKEEVKEAPKPLKSNIEVVAPEPKPKKVAKPKTITEALNVVTNKESKEQINKPKKIVATLVLYAFLGIAFLIFIAIKFSKPKKVIEGGTINDKDLKYINQTIDETKSILYNNQILESYSNNLQTQTSNDKIEETKSIKKEEILEITPQKKDTENSSKILTLSDFRDHLYSKATYFQYTNDEVRAMQKELANSYLDVKDKIFGENSKMEDKGSLGIMYLNYRYINSYMETLTSDEQKAYRELLTSGNNNYIRNVNYGFDSKKMSSKLEFLIDFSKSVDKGIYYEIPATVYEKGNRKNGQRLKLQVLKGTNIGFSQNFLLTSQLEVLDIEWNTNHNPLFTIEEVVKDFNGLKNKLKGEYDVDDMLKHTYFNNVVIDKKGYVCDIYYFSEND